MGNKNTVRLAYTVPADQAKKINKLIWQVIAQNDIVLCTIYGCMLENPHDTLGQIRHKLGKLGIYKTTATLKKFAENLEIPYRTK